MPGQSVQRTRHSWRAGSAARERGMISNRSWTCLARSWAAASFIHGRGTGSCARKRRDRQPSADVDEVATPRRTYRPGRGGPLHDALRHRRRPRGHLSPRLTRRRRGRPPPTPLRVRTAHPNIRQLLLILLIPDPMPRPPRRRPHLAPTRRPVRPLLVLVLLRPPLLLLLIRPLHRRLPRHVHRRDLRRKARRAARRLRTGRRAARVGRRSARRRGRERDGRRGRLVAAAGELGGERAGVAGLAVAGLGVADLGGDEGGVEVVVGGVLARAVLAVPVVVLATCAAQRGLAREALAATDSQRGGTSTAQGETCQLRPLLFM